MTALSTAEAALRRAPDDPAVPVTVSGAEAAALVAELDRLREIEGLQHDEWERLRAGDPDPTWGPAGDCPATRSDGLLCTRDAGHRGQHIAGCGDYIAATWMDPS